MKYFGTLLGLVCLFLLGSWLVAPTPQVTAQSSAGAVGLVDLSIRPQIVLTTPSVTATSTGTATASPTPVCILPAWHSVTVVASPTAILDRIAAAAPNDVWLVGSEIQHWTGQPFQPVPYPTPVGASVVNFYGVSAGSPNSVWAVGWSFSTYGNTLVEHWNGSQWQIISPAAAAAGGKAPLAPIARYNDVDALSPTEAYAVGYGGTGPSVIPFMSQCSTTNCTSLSHSFAGYMYSVSAPSTQDLWVTGNNTQGMNYVGHWNNGGSTLALTSTSIMFSDVAALSDTDVWVAGGSGSTGTGTTVLEHWNGSIWTTVSSPNIGRLSGIEAVAADDIWAFGYGVLHWDGNTWAQVPGQHATQIADLSPLGPADAWTTDNSFPPIVEHYAALPTFSDVPAGDTFYSYVEWMACRTIISGYTCGGAGEPCDGYDRPYFRPGNGVTRGQMLKMVVLAAGWPLLNPATATFADVAPGSTFYQVIETGYNHGIIGGYTCGTVPSEPCDPQRRPYFRPGAAVSRGQLSKILALARGYTLPNPPTGTFEDVAPGSTFYPYVEAVAAQGIVGGYPCGTVAGEPCDPQNRPYFRPGNGATRAQVSKMVTRAYGGP